MTNTRYNFANPRQLDGTPAEAPRPEIPETAPVDPPPEPQETPDEP